MQKYIPKYQIGTNLMPHYDPTMTRMNRANPLAFNSYTPMTFPSGLDLMSMYTNQPFFGIGLNAANYNLPAINVPTFNTSTNLNLAGTTPAGPYSVPYWGKQTRREASQNPEIERAMMLAGLQATSMGSGLAGVTTGGAPGLALQTAAQGISNTLPQNQDEEKPPIPWWMIANMFKPPVGGPGYGMWAAGKNIGRMRRIQEDIDTGEISADKGKRQKRLAGVTAGLGFLHEGVEQAKNFLAGRGTSTAAAHAAKEWAENQRDLMQAYTSPEMGQKDLYMNMYMQNMGGWGGPANFLGQQGGQIQNLAEGGQIPQYQIGGGSKYPSMTNPDTAEMKQHKKAAIIAGRYPSASNKEKFLAKYDPEMRRLIEYYSQIPGIDRMSQEIGLYGDIYRAEGKWSMEPFRYAGQQTGSTLKEISNYLFRTNFQQGGQIQNLEEGGQKVGGFKDTMSHFNTAAEEGLKKPSVAGFYRKDKKATMEQVAAGFPGGVRRGLDPDHPMYKDIDKYPEQYFEVEHGEKIKEVDKQGNPNIFTVIGNWHANKKVSKKGKKNGQTGEIFRINPDIEDIEVLTNYRTIGNPFAQRLKKGLGLNVHKNTTFANAADKAYDAIGINKLLELQTENFKKLVKNTGDLDTNLEKTRRTKEFNDQYLAKKINDTELALQDLKPVQVVIFDHFYQEQERQKQEEEFKNQMAKIKDFDGEFINYAKKGGPIKIPITFQDGGIYTTPEYQEAFNEWSAKNFESPVKAARALKGYFQQGGEVQQYQDGTTGIGVGTNVVQSPPPYNISDDAIEQLLQQQQLFGYNPFILNNYNNQGANNTTGIGSGLTGVTGPTGPTGPQDIQGPTGQPVLNIASNQQPSPPNQPQPGGFTWSSEGFDVLPDVTGITMEGLSGVDPNQFPGAEDWQSIQPGLSPEHGDIHGQGVTSENVETWKSNNPWFFEDLDIDPKDFKAESTPYGKNPEDVNNNIFQYQTKFNEKLKEAALKAGYTEDQFWSDILPQYGFLPKDHPLYNDPQYRPRRLDGKLGKYTLSRALPTFKELEVETEQVEETTVTDKPTLKQQPTSQPGFLPNLLTQFRMPPRNLILPAYAQVPHRAVSPFEVDPTAAIVENNRMFSAAMDQIGQMPGSQVGANTGNLLAKVADANNKAVREHGRVNLQSAMQAQQLNETMFQHADMLRYKNLLGYDELASRAYDNTMTEYKNYFETLSTDAIQRQKELIGLAIADSLAPQFTFNPWGGITHTGKSPELSTFSNSPAYLAWLESQYEKNSKKKQSS